MYKYTYILCPNLFLPCKHIAKKKINFRREAMPTPPL